MHNDSNNNSIFNDENTNNRSKTLTLISLFAIVLFTFIIIKAFINIDLNPSSDKRNVIKMLALENVIIEKSPKQEAFYQVSGRIINNSAFNITSPILKITFKDCNIFECLIVSEKKLRLTRQVIPSEQAHDFSKELDTHDEILSTDNIRIDWVIENIAFFK